MRDPQPGEWDAAKLSQQHVGDYKPFVFVDGQGVRCSLYVSGCLFAVVPGRLGVAAYSPGLDEHGNSVRAAAAIEALSDRLELHVLDRG